MFSLHYNLGDQNRWVCITHFISSFLSCSFTIFYFWNKWMDPIRSILLLLLSSFLWAITLRAHSLTNPMIVLERTDEATMNIVFKSIWYPFETIRFALWLTQSVLYLCESSIHELWIESNDSKQTSDQFESDLHQTRPASFVVGH